METIDLIHRFWFGTSSDDTVVAREQSSVWWAKNPEVDLQIRARHETHVEAAALGKYADWTKTPKGSLALILLTDQFPRNIWRETGRAFSCDAQARQITLQAIDQGQDRLLRPIERVFMYMPLEHAESMELQERSVRLYTQLFQEVPAEQIDQFSGYLTFALRHRRVIERFGRFPHRNKLLERESTPEEEIFLREPGSSF